MKHEIKMIYDINALPEGLRVDMLLKIKDAHNAVFYDGDKGSRPRFVNVGENEIDVPTLVNTSGETVSFEKFVAEQIDSEFWDRELYSCQKSLIYYYTHYATPEWPVTQPAMTAFLESHGLGNIESNDSTEAAEKWEAQKEKVKEATKDITIDMLREMKPKVDLLKELYNTKILKYELLLSGTISLHDKNGEPLEDKIKTKRVIKYIKTQPVHKLYSQYRTKKQTWDMNVLNVTDYPELLVMAHHVAKEDPNFKFKVDPNDKKKRDAKIKKAIGVGQ